MGSYHPLAEWPLTAADQTNLCQSATVTISATVAGTTTCIAPVETAGTACPSATAGMALTDLQAAPASTPTDLPAGATASLGLAVADSASVPASLVGADVIADVAVTAVAGSWQARAHGPDSETQL